MLGMRKSISGFHNQVGASDGQFEAFSSSFKAYLSRLWTSKSQFLALSDDLGHWKLILCVFLDLWESILECASLFRSLKFDFMHWGVIPGPLGFDFWAPHVRPYNRVFKIGLWESVCLRCKNLIFSWIKSDCENPIFLDEKNPMYFVNKIWLL